MPTMPTFTGERKSSNTCLNQIAFGGASGAGAAGSSVGAAHAAGTQVTATTTAGTLMIARPTRRTALIRNMDASNNVYVGPATVTTGNGTLIQPLESLPVTWTGLWQVITSSGTAVVSVLDEYD